MLLVRETEGVHYELSAMVDGDRRIYVLIPADENVERALEARVGQRVRVTASDHQDVNIFMRGPVIRVTAVFPSGAAGGICE